MVRKVLLFFAIAIGGVTLPEYVTAEPEHPCRHCTSWWDAGVVHMHTSQTCMYLQVNCWSCEGSTCHWGTPVFGTCSSHGHEPCGVDESLAAVRWAVGESDGIALVQAVTRFEENVQLDSASGYALVLDCSGNVAAAYRMPAAALAFARGQQHRPEV
jgi:hypothetical protein